MVQGEGQVSTDGNLAQVNVSSQEITTNGAQDKNVVSVLGNQVPDLGTSSKLCLSHPDLDLENIELFPSFKKTTSE